MEAASTEKTTQKIMYSTKLNMWLVTDYDSVVEVLRNNKLFVPASSYDPMLSKLGVCESAKQVMNELVPLNTTRMATSTAYKHKRIKGSVQKYFNLHAVRSYSENVVFIANKKLERFNNKTTVDLVEDYCRDISLESLLSVLGVPEKDFTYVRNLHEKITSLFSHVLSEDEQNDCANALKTLKEYIRQLFDRHDNDTKQNITAQLINEMRADELELTLEEVIQLYLDIISAGFDTTFMAMSWTLYYLLRDRNLWMSLVDDVALPEKILPYVMESLRLNMAQMGLVRTTLEDCTISEVKIPKNALLYVMHTVANRDPSLFENPNKFDLHRDNITKQLTFGFGEHYCLGADFAKREIALAVIALRNRFPNMKIVDSPDAIKVSQNSSIRRLDQLLVSLNNE